MLTSTLDGIQDLFTTLDDTIREYMGGCGFDILVNNAGIGQIISLEETTEVSFDEVMKINVKAPLLLLSKLCHV